MIIQSKEIRIVPISELHPNPKNRNVHSAAQIERLGEIIKYQGFRNPLIVSKRTGFIVAGHGRLLAAKELKLKEVPVIYEDFEDEDQEYAAGISDNAIASWAELDLSGINADIPELGPFDIDLLGIKDFELEPADKYGDQDADEVPKSRTTTIVAGDLFSLGSHRLLCGDSTDAKQVERLMNGEKADMVFTDPPYNVDYDYNFSNDKRTDEEYRKFLTDVFDLCSQILKSEATVYVKNAPRNLPGFFPIMKDWNLNNLIVWPHSCQFHPQNRFSTNWESISAFTRGNPVFNAKAQVQEVNTPIRLKGLVKLDGRIDDVWADIPWLSAGAMVSKETVLKEGTNSKAHPCQMPIALARRGIVFSSNKENIVYEPFSGSGTTLLACEETVRKCRAVEMDPVYVQLAIDRWEKFTGKKATKL